MAKKKNLTLLRLPAVSKKVCLSKPSIYRKVRDGSFPKPKKIGERAVAWLETDVDAWIQGLPS